MPRCSVPLSSFSHRAEHRGKRPRGTRSIALARWAAAKPQPARRSHRLALYSAALLLAGALYGGVTLFWQWPHVISSSGGRYFTQRVVLPIPFFAQDDPRWANDVFDAQGETLGSAGCAITSAAMVLASYGVPTDPRRLNFLLLAQGGYTPQGWLDWDIAAQAVSRTTGSPGRIEKAYEGLPTYGAIDGNLWAGNPVIVRLQLRSSIHFVVLVGKSGWDYLAQDPARLTRLGIYPLRDLTPTIRALRYFRSEPAKP